MKGEGGRGRKRKGEEGRGKEEGDRRKARRRD
jgi:hypothetical protein